MAGRARRALGGLALVALGALALAAAFARRSFWQAPGPGPYLVVSSEAPDSTLLPDSDRADVRTAAAALTVATLSDEAARALAAEIHRWHVLVDIAHNPLSVDLEDDDLGARMKATSAQLSPSLAAATSLLSGVARADDGLTVEVARACPTGARCVDLSGGAASTGDDDRLEGRARFLAWGLGHALHVRVRHEAGQPSETAAAARQLRERVQAEGQTVALVVDEASLASPASAAALAVQKEADGLTRALGKRAPAAQLSLARSFAGGSLPAAVAPWLTLEDEILVVPKLAYVGRPAEFVAEVRRLVSELDRPSLVVLDPE
jgi:hypothetical protein